jgi:hypothetical protein
MKIAAHAGTGGRGCSVQKVEVKIHARAAAGLQCAAMLPHGEQPFFSPPTVPHVSIAASAAAPPALRYFH